MDGLLQSTDSTSCFYITRGTDKLICIDYDKFRDKLVESLYDSDNDYGYSLDSRFNPVHSLIFQAIVVPKTRVNNFDLLMRFVDIIFINVLEKHVGLPEITLILAMPRNKCGGLRIYVLNVKIYHDDYIELWQAIRKMSHYRENGVSVSLNCPSRFYFPASGPENDSLYVPVCLKRVRFGYFQENDVWHSRKIENVFFQQQENENFFDHIVCHPAAWKDVARSMMPFPQTTAVHLHYPTKIVPGKDSNSIAEFTSSLNEFSYSIVKENSLTKICEGGIYCYEFLLQNTPYIDNFTCRYNQVLNIWFNRFHASESSLINCKEIDQKLRKMCPHLNEIPSPLEAVIKAFERPVYYALYNILKDETLIRQQFPTLSADLHIPKESSRLTFNTILYMAYQLGATESKLSRFTQVGMGWDWILKSITTMDQMKDYILFLQQKHFPIVKGPEKRYFWDAVFQKWVEIKNLDEDLENVLCYTVDMMVYFPGYNCIQGHVRDALKKDSIWMKSLLNLMRANLENSEITIGNGMTESFMLYGQNVPEYYFFFIYIAFFPVASSVFHTKHVTIYFFHSCLCTFCWVIRPFREFFA